MSYKITDYTFNKARQIGVEIRPSHLPGKKIDIYKDGKLISSVGAIGYSDYPTYLKEKGKAYADKRRILYYNRHTKDSLNEIFARFLLW